MADTKRRLQELGFDDDAFLDPRFVRLCDLLRERKRVAVAYSGGVDSTFLLHVARRVLGDGALGVLGVSESLDQSELAQARATAEAMEVPLDIVQTHEYDNPAYRRNDGSRCYHCKSELFATVRRHAQERGFDTVLDGSNADDAGDYRPGMRARDEQGVRSPLMEVGLDKETIRVLSRALGLTTWDKPAAPCLASRIPHGEAVTDDKLRQVERAEGALRALGYRVVRVRHHGQVARIEVPGDDVARLLEAGARARVVEAVKRAGFPFVAVDLEGFRSGSLNEVLAERDDAGRSPQGASEGTWVPVGTVRRLDSRRDSR